jgi:predicted house-cleaning NTP pyrophosphatase (Maf/HAM1 superfamily)
MPSTLNEEKIIGKNPLDTLRLRAKLKGEEVFRMLQCNNVPMLQRKYPKSNDQLARHYSSDARCYLILSADSGAIINNQLIGKPKDYKDAARILKLLSGRTHRFVTAVYFIKLLMSPKLLKKSLYDSSFVTFRKLSKEDIKRYLSLTDYTQYAGGYAIASPHRLRRSAVWRASAQNFITKIEGSISNVIGLSLEKVIPILQENKLLK